MTRPSPLVRAAAGGPPAAPITSPAVPLLTASNLAVGYRYRRRITTTLSEVNLSVRQGDLIALVGGNGAGKSTLLRSLTGVQAPLSGTISLVGRDITQIDRRQRARHIALVLADRLEAVNLTVEELVSLGRHPYSGMSGQLDDDDRAIVSDAMAATGVTRFAHRPIGQLSDGERQRVAIARAVAQEPDVLVLDEPTAFLDPRARQSILALLESLTGGHRFAAIIATHDLELVLPRATDVWIAGEGRIASGTLDDDTVLRALTNELGAGVTRVDGRTHITYEPLPDSHRRSTDPCRSSNLQETT